MSSTRTPTSRSSWRRTLPSSEARPRALRPGRGASALLVADAAGRFAGVLTATDLRAATGSVGAVIQPAAATVPRATPVADLLAPVSAGDVPVVVVDDAGRPCGVVAAHALLAAVAGVTPEDRRADAAHSARGDGDRPELAGAAR